MGRNVFVLDGTTSDGDAFDFPGARFDSLADAVDYARRYASSVSGTDEVIANDTEGWVIAFGTEYSETIRVREIVAR